MLLRTVTTCIRTSIALPCAMLVAAGAYSQSKDSSATSTPVVVGGYVDSYFSFNFDRPLTHANQFRNFDVTENQVNLANAELSITKAAAPLGFRVDLDFGPTNDIVQSGATGSIADVGQAYITYVAPLGQGLTIDAGKFVTHMGYEVIKAKDDWNYTRSLLFALSIPYYHLGVRATYPFSSTFSLCVHMYNSYNGLTVSSGKTFGFQAIYSPSSVLSLTANYIGGPVFPDTISKKFRNVAELIAAIQATPTLSFAIDGVYGQDNLPSGAALWKGIAAYLHYTLSDPCAITLRGEIYNDPKGYTTGTSQDIKEVTLTYEYRPLTNLILRAEYRYDSADGLIYDGNGGALTRRNQATLDIGAIVVF